MNVLILKFKYNFHTLLLTLSKTINLKTFLKKIFFFGKIEDDTNKMDAVAMSVYSF